MKDLDEILSGNAPAQASEPVVSEPEKSEPEANTEPTAEGRPRTPDGKFASKEPSEPEGDKPEEEPRKGTVPQAALHAEREKRRSADERAAELERQLAELRGKVDGIAQTRQPEPPVKEQEKPDFWSAPDKYVESALTPLQREQLADRMTFSHEIAVTRYGEETVQQAIAALKEAVAKGAVDGAAVQATLSRSRHPINEIVQWHKNSPEVREAELRAKIEAEVREKVLADLGQQQSPAPAAPAPTVMPSNLAGVRNVGTRSGPAWSGPASLNDIFDRSRSRKTG